MRVFAANSVPDPDPDPWMSAMRRGDFTAAWEISDRVLAERCARGVDCSRWPRHLQFIWNGASIDDKHVFVRCYHGLGDTIQYARLLEPLRRRARRVTVWAQPELLELLTYVRGHDALLSLHEGVPDVDYDVDIELMELAHALRITAANLPRAAPYIRFDPTGMRRDGSTHAQRVGLVWQSGHWDANRTIPTELLRPLASVPDVEFHSLQFPPADLPFAARTMACRDIARMARRMLSLDLVISVDTMVAHLAGALGLPTWVLLNDRADWRWLDEGYESRWYPTMRLFRRRSDWAALIHDVTQALAMHSRCSRAARKSRKDGSPLARG